MLFSFLHFLKISNTCVFRCRSWGCVRQVVEAYQLRCAIKLKVMLSGAQGLTICIVHHYTVQILHIITLYMDSNLLRTHVVILNSGKFRPSVATTYAVLKTVMVTTSNLVNPSPLETVVEGTVVELS